MAMGRPGAGSAGRRGGSCWGLRGGGCRGRHGARRGGRPGGVCGCGSGYSCRWRRWRRWRRWLRCRRVRRVRAVLRRVDGARGHTGHDEVGAYVIGDDRSRADHRAGSYPPAPHHASLGADPCPGAHLDIATDPCARGKSGVVPQAAVVGHAGADVHQHVPACLDIGREAGESADHGARSEFDVPAQTCPGVDERGGAPSAGAGIPIDPRARDRRADADQILGLQPAEQVEPAQQAGAAAGEQVQVYLAIVDEPQEAVGVVVAGGVYRFDEVEELTAVAASPHYDELASAVGHAATVRRRRFPFN